MLSSAPLALAGGSFIFLAVIIIMFFAVAYGYFTVKGSGINTRPWAADSDGGSAPGAEGQEEVSGKDQGEGSALNTHGTK